VKKQTINGFFFLIFILIAETTEWWVFKEGKKMRASDTLFDKLAFEGYEPPFSID